MPRKKFEYDEYNAKLNLGFDPSEPSETMSPKYAASSFRAQRYKSGKLPKSVAGKRSAVQDAHDQNKIYVLRRMLAGADTRFAAKAIKQAMSGHDRQHIVKTYPIDGVTLLTANHSRSLFGNLYASDASHLDAIAEYNQVVKAASDNINEKNAKIRTRLGEICIFGPENMHGQAKPNIVYLDVSQNGAEQLYEDHQTVVRALRSHKGLATHSVAFTPHLSIATVDSRDAALDLQARLQERLADRPDVFEREIALGRAALSLRSVI